MSQKERQFTELLTVMASQGLKLRGFALKHGIDKSILSRLINGRYARMDPKLVAKVHAATDGAVGLEQFSAFYARLAEPDQPMAETG